MWISPQSPWSGRRRISPIRLGPLTLLVIAAFALPLVGSQVAQSSAPSPPKDRWPAANAPQEIDYRGAGFVSRPAGANAPAAVSPDEAVRSLGLSPLAPTPEVALRLVSRHPANAPYGPDWIPPGESLLVYLVVFRDIIPDFYGGPYREDPDQRFQLDPNLRCIEVRVVDAQTGRPVSGMRAAQLC